MKNTGKSTKKKFVVVFTNAYLCIEDLYGNSGYGWYSDMPNYDCKSFMVSKMNSKDLSLLIKKAKKDLRDRKQLDRLNLKIEGLANELANKIP